MQKLQLMPKFLHPRRHSFRLLLNRAQIMNQHIRPHTVLCADFFVLFSPRFLGSAGTKTPRPPSRRTRTSKVNIIYRCDNMVRARNSALVVQSVRILPGPLRPETSVSLRRICKYSPPNLETHGEQYSREGVERADARPLAEIGAHCFLYSCRCCRTTIRSPIPVSFSHAVWFLLARRRNDSPKTGSTHWPENTGSGVCTFYFEGQTIFVSSKAANKEMRRNMTNPPPPPPSLLLLLLLLLLCFGRQLSAACNDD